MSKRMKQVIAVIPAVAVLGIAAPAVADGHGHSKVAEFYKGKTVTVMVPSGLGATLGLYGRLTTEHLGKHIPGNPTVIIQSRPGGGGTKGAAYAYNAAPKDGTYIAEALAPSVLAPLLRNMKFDASKFQWLGSIAPRPAVISVWHKAPIKTLAEAKKVEAIMGSTGLGSETFLAPTLLNHIAGTKFKIVKGYKGGAKINKAMEGGEVHGRMNYWSGWTAGKPAWVRDKKLHHIASYGGHIPALPNIPKMIELAKKFGFEAIVIDPRDTFAKKTSYHVEPDALHVKWPQEILNDFKLDQSTYAVILSHDPKIDDEALKILLKSNVRYIGALGSKRTHAKRLARLQEYGFSEEDISKIHAPIGVPINALLPKEIALSIMAEVINAKNS